MKSQKIILYVNGEQIKFIFGVESLRKLATIYGPEEIQRFVYLWGSDPDNNVRQIDIVQMCFAGYRGEKNVNQFATEIFMYMTIADIKHIMDEFAKFSIEFGKKSGLQLLSN